jgi:FlaA1/EpsC-like NDP-sugar epimerase
LEWIKLIKKAVKKLSKLDRRLKQLIMVLSDSLIILAVLLGSFSLRFGYLYWPTDELLIVILVSPLIAIPIFIGFRLYISITRYIGSRTLLSTVQAVSLYAIAWGLFAYMSSIENIPGAKDIPRSIVFINWMFSIISLVGVRILASWIFSNQSHKNHLKKNVIIYGAGDSGRQLSLALQISDKYSHIAFIDDDELKSNTYINNIPVYKSIRIESLIDKNKVNEILLALPSASRKRHNEIYANLKKFNVNVRNLPSISKFTEGKVKIDDLFEIEIGDLLGREQVEPNKNLLTVKITNKVVLVTGAGGSIGSELCRQILNLKPKSLILFESSESSLYQIEQELINLNDNSIDIVPILGSVQDFNRMKYIFNFYNAETIYHAAAFKHVPLVESNKSQAVLNNSIGTLYAAEAAISSGVKTFVLISTDKAVRPSSVMGATKRIAELILQSLAKNNSLKICLTMVRFGNVLDSSGSVIPLFKKQIRSGGPVTVTDSNMVRYFMTIPEAVELVIQAGAMGKGGDVFVLDMGKPVKIYDLAVNMIKLSGLQLLDATNPDGDIEIQFTGLRPGEKLYEELLVGDDVTETENKLIMRAKEKMIEWEELKPILNQLQEASLVGDESKIKKLLKRAVPEYR